MSLGHAEWPETGEMVVATVSRIESYGAYVALDEYDNKEALLHISEISSRWVRNIRNHVRENQKVVLQVLRVDPSKGQVDLSLRRVNKDDRRKKIEQWKKTRKGERDQAVRKQGYGGQKFPMQHNQAKVTKKTTLQLQCKECKHSLMREGVRLKKAELE